MVVEMYHPDLALLPNASQANRTKEHDIPNHTHIHKHKPTKKKKA